MDKDGKTLLKLMFRPGETVCVSPNQYAYHSVGLPVAVGENIPLVSNNANIPISYCSSDSLVFVALNPIQGYRNDDNCYKYRNFMMEMDDGTIPEQIGYLLKLGVPHSAMIFSGGKSIHTLIALEEEVPSEKTYRFLAEWILNIATLVDRNIKNPSRCIRIPGATRDNGNKQRAYFMGKRVKLADLMAWLHQYDHLMPKERVKKRRKDIDASFDDLSNLSYWARDQILNGFKFNKGRNAGWFALGYDFALAGYNEDATVDFLALKFVPDHDFKEKEFELAVRKGFKQALEAK